MKQIMMSVLLLCSFLSAETEFAEPKPSLENPRKFVFPITKDERSEINHVLSSANNVMKFYGPEKVEVVIVAYSKGIKAVMNNKDIEIKKRVEALLTYEVEFIACGNTMQTLKIDKTELIDGVEVVTAGIVELIERQLRGYTYIRP